MITMIILTKTCIYCVPSIFFADIWLLNPHCKPTEQLLFSFLYLFYTLENRRLMPKDQAGNKG